MRESILHPESEKKPVSILIIDDNNEYIKSLLRVFRGEEGVLPIVCKSKEKAIKAIEENNPAGLRYIFLDHHLSEEEKGEV